MRTKDFLLANTVYFNSICFFAFATHFISNNKSCLSACSFLCIYTHKIMSNIVWISWNFSCTQWEKMLITRNFTKKHCIICISVRILTCQLAKWVHEKVTIRLSIFDNSGDEMSNWTALRKQQYHKHCSLNLNVSTSESSIICGRERLKRWQKRRRTEAASEINKYLLTTLFVRFISSHKLESNGEVLVRQE